MNPSFVGSGAHWRVLRAPDRLLPNSVRWWQVYRRHWDHWEAVGTPCSQYDALTEAHRLARLSRA